MILDNELDMNLQDTPVVDPATESVPLNGWDMVFAITFKDVNAAIKHRKTTPKAFSFRREDEGGGPFDAKYALNGEYDDWRMTLGGDGVLARMAIPAKTLDLNVTMGGKTYPYSVKKGVTFTIEVHLDWVTEDQKVHLVLGKGKHTASLDVLTADFEDAEEAEIFNHAHVEPILKDLIKEMLISDVEKFEHVFGTVNYAKDLSDLHKQKFEWLTPTSHHYGVAQRVTTDKDKEADPMSLGVLNIMSMSGNRPNPTTGNAPNNIIPPGANAGFAFNEKFVIQNFMLPAMTEIFPGCDIAKDFVLTSDGCSFTNTRDLLMKKMERDHTWIRDHDKLSPMVRLQAPKSNFSIFLENGHVVFDMSNLNYERTPRLNAIFVVKHRCSLNMDKDGNFGIVSPPNTESNIKHYLIPIEKEGGQKAFWLGLAKDLLISLVIMAVAMGGAMYISGRMRVKTKSMSSEGGETASDVTKGKAPLEEANLLPEEFTETLRGDEASGMSETTKGSDISKATLEETVTNKTQGKPGKFSKFLGTNMGEMLLMMFFQMFLTDAISIERFYEDYVAGDNYDVKALHSIAKVGFSGMEWPNASDKGYKIVEGGLRHGAFRIGVNMEFDH